MPFKLIFQPSGIRGEAGDGETVLDAARNFGEGIESVCGGQGVCGKCRFRPLDGEFTPPTAQEHEMLNPVELGEGYRLACLSRPLTDAAVYIPDEARAVSQVVLGDGVSRPFEIDPAVVKYYIELDPPSLSNPSADAERLISGLDRKYGLKGLRISYQVLGALPSVLREGGWRVTATVREGGEVVRVEPGFVPHVLGAAFDVGTTTVAGWLFDLSSGRMLAKEAMTNPQVAMGEDVMSRISYAVTHEGGADRLGQAVVEGLNGMLDGMLEAYGGQASADDVMEVVLVGNTLMHHLLLGLPVGQLGVYPFTPAVSRGMEAGARGLGFNINACGYVVTLPVIGGFVGADNAAAIVAAGPFEGKGSLLLVDVGTNGEIVLYSGGRYMAASCATGPAFEGAQLRHGMRAAEGAIERVSIDPETKEASFKVIGRAGWSGTARGAYARGICGSGVVDAVAQMYLAGIIDRRGSFVKGLDTPRMRQGASGLEYVIAWSDETSADRDITLSQEDVRAVQLAKAALRAGAEVLMGEMGVESPDAVLLAGAFGNYMDVDNALALGILPYTEPGKVSPIGNAAGEGAKAALINRGVRAYAQDVADRVRYLELSTHPRFQDEFMAGMDFPER